jgi:hypothetical protein
MTTSAAAAEATGWMMLEMGGCGRRNFRLYKRRAKRDQFQNTAFESWGMEFTEGLNQWC